MKTFFALVETLWLSGGAFLFFALTLVLGGEYADNFLVYQQGDSEDLNSVSQDHE